VDLGGAGPNPPNAGFDGAEVSTNEDVGLDKPNDNELFDPNVDSALFPTPNVDSDFAFPNPVPNVLLSEVCEDDPNEDGPNPLCALNDDTGLLGFGFGDENANIPTSLSCRFKTLSIVCLYSFRTSTVSPGLSRTPNIVSAVLLPRGVTS
jgi:hypothetical protein